VRLLEHMQSHDKVWFCRGIDSARHWRARFPAPAIQPGAQP
jgi:allantoinase